MPTPDVDDGQPELSGESPPATAGGKQPLPPAAERALAEAAARAAARNRSPEKPAEVGGPSGPDPVRYGDWERKGIASDF
jgi:hypothetical protein